MKISDFISVFTITALISFGASNFAEARNNTAQNTTTVSVSMPAINHSGTLPAPETGARNFIEDLTTQALGYHEDPTLAQEEKMRVFASLLESRFDMNTISRFVLGRYWRVATPEQQKEYKDLFQRYVVNIYTQRFDEFKTYDVSTIDTEKVRRVSKKDFIVQSVIRFADQPDVAVEWRVRNKKGNYQIVDVMIEGVSMSVTQRSDFSSVIQRGGGNVEVLLSYLRKNT